MRLTINPALPLVAQIRPFGLDEGVHQGDILYRFFDIAERLLYVGVTMRPQGRWQAHKTSAEWWPRVATVLIERHPYTNAALVAEVRAIRTEAPEFNRRSAPLPQVCAERVYQHSALTCIGKGREGKGRGREDLAKTIHDLRLLGVASRNRPGYDFRGRPIFAPVMDGASR